MLWIWTIGFAFFIALVHLLYIRYVPIKGVPCVDPKEKGVQEKIAVDIRDYQKASNDPVAHAIVMPVPYIKRYYNEIPSKTIFVIASDHLEKNIAIRLLKSKGFQVVGYTLTDCKCKKKIEKLA
ncbi:hypothetical protein [Gracilibacillus sp. YIM 98692]|uniref:hypothetical protein n=1 Tax=Gracilibacillus sp. YIM 98692 TaxID=2663532 RepID=UPI0013D65357|nr:hypothetical protein [Gracilibacillus sp. YIM 98692]